MPKYNKVKKLIRLLIIPTILITVSSILFVGCATRSAQFHPDIERAQLISQLEDDHPPFDFNSF